MEINETLADILHSFIDANSVTEEKWRVYKHERKQAWVVDPPGFDTKENPNDRSPVEWKDAGGRVIEGYVPAMQHALSQALLAQWIAKGRKSGEIF